MSLNFKEKRALQKTVTEQQAALRGGSLGFKEKREAQKLLRDALAKLGAGAGSKPIAAGLSYRVYPSEPGYDGPGAKGRVIIAARPGISMGSRVEKVAEDKFAVLAGDGEAGGSGGAIGEVLRSEGKFKAKYRSGASDYNGLVDDAVSVLTEIHANGADPFAGAPAKVEIPQSVKSALDLLIAPLAEIAMGLESARATDRRFSAGDGRYAGEFMSSEGTVEKLNAAEKAISDRIGSIPDVARRAAAEAYVRSNRPDLSLTDAEREWAGFDPAPAIDSPFAQLLAGDFNRLPVPEFVTKLEGAYAEEEDLEKAKQAAIQYLEANRETLEAA